MIGLNKKTEYAIELVMALARQKSGQPVSLREIAKDRKLPLKFLEQVAVSLKWAGIVESKEGRGGGYVLVPKPKDITVAEVVEAVEGPVQIGGCFGCPKAEACGQKNVWEEVGDKVKQTMQKKTIASLVDSDAQRGVDGKSKIKDQISKTSSKLKDAKNF